MEVLLCVEVVRVEVVRVEVDESGGGSEWS